MQALLKNLIPYTVSSETKLPSSIPEWKKLLSEKTFREIEEKEVKVVGWQVDDNKEPLVRAINNYTFFSLITQEKKPNSKQIQDLTKERITSLEEKENRKLKKIEVQAIKDDVIQSLLPTTFPTTTVQNVIYDSKNHLLLIEGTSENKTSIVTSLLRRHSGSLPVQPLTFTQQLNLSNLFIQCIKEQKLSHNGKDLFPLSKFTLEGEKGTVINYSNFSFSESDLTTLNEYIEQGYEVNSIAIEYDILSCTFTSGNIFKSIKLIDVEIDEDIVTKDEDDLLLFGDAILGLLTFFASQLGGFFQKS